MTTTKIYHVLSSPLFRYNGIVEFIRASIEKFGGEAVTDCRPGITTPFVVTYDHKNQYQYQLEFAVTDWGLGSESHPWLHWSDEIVGILEKLVAELPQDCKIYTHCAMSQQACRNLGIPAIFVQHESDVYYPQKRLSYLSDHWLNRHRDLMLDTVIGATMPPTPEMRYFEFVTTSYPIYHDRRVKTADLGEFVVITDSSYRKGWDRYHAFWQAHGQPSTSVITREPDSRWPRAWQVRGFDFFQINDKLQFIRNHNRAFIPSRSEVTCLALLECVSQIPTYVFDDEWTLPYAGQVTRIKST